MVKCERPETASLDALTITKKTLADLSKGLTKLEVVNKIDRFLAQDKATPEGRCFIAHNWSFDKKFVHALYEEAGKFCPVDLWLCTMALTKAYAKQMGIIKPKVNLQAACDLTGIKKYATAHASAADTRNAFLLFKDLTENKKIDYLPFIKTAKHSPIEDERLDINDLDMSDVF